MTLIDQPHTSVSGELTPEAVSGFRHRFEQDSNAVRMQNAVTRTGLDDVALRRDRFIAIPSSVSNRLDDWKVNQPDEERPLLALRRPQPDARRHEAASGRQGLRIQPEPRDVLGQARAGQLLARRHRLDRG